MRARVSSCLCFISLLYFALSIAPAQAQGYQFAFHFGSFGTGPGEFDDSHDVAVDSKGNIYVADFNNERVQKFTSRGDFVLQWGSPGTGEGQFDGPIAIAIDALDNVYVVDVRNDRIQKFDSSGNFQRAWGTSGTGDGQFEAPSDAHVGPNGNIFVTDRKNHRIQKFTSDGGFLRKWGSLGSQNGQFEFPTGLFVTNSNVYVADQHNDRIQRFTLTGDFRTVFGSLGSGPGQLDKPTDVVVDSNGNVVVVDKNNQRIQVFGFDGEFISQFGTLGSAPGQFNEPRGAAIDAQDTLYVAERGNHRIQVFVPRKDFELTNQVSVQGDNFGQSIAISGQLVAIGAPGRDGGDGTVDIYRREGNQLVFEDEILVPSTETAAEFGTSVALQNDILVIGAPADPLAKGTSLQAAIFQRLSQAGQGNWQFKFGLRSNNQTTNDRFGAAVGISGNMVAVGAPNDSNGRGATYLFRINPNETVDEVAKILPPIPGGKGTSQQQFGASVAFKKGRLAVGGPGNGTNTGLAALFNNVATNLNNPITVTGSNTAGDSFGDAVSLSGNSMLIGAPGDDAEMGKAFFFPIGGNQVTKIPITPANRPANGRFGDSVALRLRRAIIGSPGATQQAKGTSTTGVAFGFDLGDSGATSQDTDEPPANTCTAKVAKGCGDVVSYGAAAAIEEGITVVGAPLAINGEGTTFVTLETLKLFSDSYEGERSAFE